MKKIKRDSFETKKEKVLFNSFIAIYQKLAITCLSSTT